MKDQIWEYVVGLYRDIPYGVYETLSAVLCIGAVVLMVVYGFRKGARLIAGLLLAEYVFLLYSSTVIFRTTSEKFSGYDFHPFWSYRAILSGEDPQLLVENIMNVVVFMPVGVLLGFMVHGSQDSQARMSDKVESRCMVRHGWLIALLAGLFISVSIEALQFFLHRGFAEVDDVMHNTIGCLIGYGLFKLIRSILLIF